MNLFTCGMFQRFLSILQCSCANVFGTWCLHHIQDKHTKCFVISNWEKLSHVVSHSFPTFLCYQGYWYLYVLCNICVQSLHKQYAFFNSGLNCCFFGGFLKFFLVVDRHSGMNRVVQDLQPSAASMALFSETRQEWKQDTPLLKSWIDPQRVVENQ